MSRPKPMAYSSFCQKREAIGPANVSARVRSPARFDLLTWVGEARRLEQNVVEGTLLLHEPFDGRDANILDTAAQASVRKLKELFRLLRRVVRGGYVDCLR